MIWYANDLLENPQAFIPFVLALGLVILLGLAFHEFCHAWAAYELGDDTAKRQGRLTLNPLAHIDPIGTALIAVIGFGWAKPTPFNPLRLSLGPDKGGAVVAFAGPASNFVFAAAAAIPLRLGLFELSGGLGRPGETTFESIIARGTAQDFVVLFLLLFVSLNILLGLFNLLPIAPLDGFKVLTGIAPKEISQPLKALEPWGPGLLIGLIAIGWLTPFNPIGAVIGGLSTTVADFLLA
jgi:Zn-dependent protease